MLPLFEFAAPPPIGTLSWSVAGLLPNTTYDVTGGTSPMAVTDGLGNLVFNTNTATPVVSLSVHIFPLITTVKFAGVVQPGKTATVTLNGMTIGGNGDTIVVDVT